MHSLHRIKQIKIELKPTLFIKNVSSSTTHKKNFETLKLRNCETTEF